MSIELFRETRAGHLTVEECRQALGAKADGRSNAELEQLVHWIEAMARLIVETTLAQKKAKQKGMEIQ